MPSLTAKELTALDDQLNMEKILVKKYETYSANCTDPMIQSKFRQIAETHRTHYNKLMTFLG